MQTTQYIQNPNPDNNWIGIKSGSEHQMKRAVKILEHNLYTSLATCSNDGYPWCSPVFFVYDPDWNIYWASAINSTHSQNIYSNSGRVSMTIYDSNVPEGSSAEGLYFIGRSVEVNQANTVQYFLNLARERTGKTIERIPLDYLGESVRRIYKFIPERTCWLTGDRLSVGNQLVDTKIELKF